MHVSSFIGQPVRVLSDTISKSLKKVSKKAEHAGPDSKRSASAPIDSSPFVQYGTGDDERETGAKRTHNILSKEGVSYSCRLRLVFNGG